MSDTNQIKAVQKEVAEDGYEEERDHVPVVES